MSPIKEKPGAGLRLRLTRVAEEASGEFSDMDEDALEAEIQKVEAQLKTGNEKEKGGTSLHYLVKKHKKKREVKAEAKIAVEAEEKIVKTQVKNRENLARTKAIGSQTTNLAENAVSKWEQS